MFPQGKISEQIKELLSLEAPWPVFTAEKGTLEYTTQKYKVGDILDISTSHADHPALLFELFTAKISLLMRSRNAHIARFREEYPHVDISELEKYWDNKYPAKDAITAKGDEYFLDEDTPDFNDPDFKEKMREVDRLQDQLNNLPPRAEVMLKLLDDMPIDPEHKSDLAYAIIQDIFMEDIEDKGIVSLNKLSESLTRLRKLIDMNAPEQIMSGAINSLRKFLEQAQSTMREMDSFAYDDTLAELHPGLRLKKDELSESHQTDLQIAKEGTKVAVDTMESILMNIEKIVGPAKSTSEGGN